MRSDQHLPPSWSYATIGDISVYVQRGKSPKYTDRSDLPVVNQKCVRWYGVDPAHLKFVHPDQWADWGLERFLQDGDILWNSTGTGTIGRAALYRPIAQVPRMVADSHVTIIRTGEYIPKLLHYWISSPAVQSKIDAMQTGSTNQVELSKDQVLNTAVPVPPLNEQLRIVAKIEELTNHSRRAREALDAVPALLERFRQSVLAAAFRGDLTAEWRAKNPEVEPASVLLERIRQERRRKWEEDLRAKGKDLKKAVYPEPEKPGTSNLPTLPEGWCWASVSELSTKVVDGVHKKPEYVTEGIPFVTIKNLTRGPGISFEELNYISPEDHVEYFKRANPEKGDILISKDGTLGVTRLIETDAVFSIFVSVALIKPVIPEISGYFSWALQSPQVQEQMVPVGSGLQHIHLTDLRKDCIPLAPLEEQVEILNQVSSLLSSGNSVTDLLASMGGQVDRLDQSILAQAFRGELVPQDPTDEPASVLLERIRGEKAEAVVPKARRGRKPRELAEARG